MVTVHMTSIGTVLRMIGAAILLIAVQFAPIAARAHSGHGHEPDGHQLQAQHFHAHGAAAATAAHATSSDHAPAAPAEPAAQVEASAQNSPDAQPSTANACVMGCCGSTGCCGAALAAVSPSLPPKACPLRIGFARPISVRGVDPQGLRKPPRSLA
jgi:hypothetical protein